MDLEIFLLLVPIDVTFNNLEKELRQLNISFEKLFNSFASLSFALDLENCDNRSWKSI